MIITIKKKIISRSTWQLFKVRLGVLILLLFQFGFVSKSGPKPPTNLVRHFTLRIQNCMISLIAARVTCVGSRGTTTGSKDWPPPIPFDPFYCTDRGVFRFIRIYAGNTFLTFDVNVYGWTWWSPISSMHRLDSTIPENSTNFKSHLIAAKST